MQILIGCRQLLYILFENNYAMSNETELSNTMYDLLHAMGKDAGFLYETIDTYIKDAQNANKSDLVETWQTIKKDRLKHLHMLKEALEKEIHG